MDIVINNLKNLTVTSVGFALAHQGSDIMFNENRAPKETSATRIVVGAIVLAAGVWVMIDGIKGHFRA